MIDIHSHLLPGVDDGAGDLEESLAMARIYVEEGFAEVVVTPHWIDDRIDLHRYHQAFSLLEDELRKRDMPLELSMGHEFFVTLGLAEKIEEGWGKTLGDSPYVLVEFPMFEKAPYLDRVLYELLLKGYQPIIAHPERYGYVIENPNLLLEWIQKGIRVQMNIPSLIGRHGKKVRKTAEILLEHDMVHFLATDSHSSGVRSPRVMQELRNILSAEEIRKFLFHHPRALFGGPLPVWVEPRRYKKKKFFIF